MTKRYFLDNDFIRQNAIVAIKNAPVGYVVEVKKPSRSLDQNRKLWAMLNDLAAQVCWHGRWLNKDDWKHLLTASLTKQEPVQGIDQGTLVLLGQSTSAMSKELFRDLIELIYVFGVEHNVEWSRDALDVFEEYLKNNVGVMAG